MQVKSQYFYSFGERFMEAINKLMSHIVCGGNVLNYSICSKLVVPGHPGPHAFTVGPWNNSRIF